MGESEIISRVKTFHKSISDVPDHRYKSWEHCYSFFKRIRNKELNEKDLELAQLHLAFYLASWGMYRGSSFLLQKDYTVYDEIVKEILKQKYNLLADVDANYEDIEKLKILFFEVYSKIRSILKNIKKTIPNHADLTKTRINQTDVSDILITKILMGTLGCIPAYDRFFISGLGQRGLMKKFNPKRSLNEMVDFYIKNKLDFDQLRKEIKGYPFMKLIDMYFWNLGYMPPTKKEQDLEKLMRKLKGVC